MLFARQLLSKIETSRSNAEWVLSAASLGQANPKLPK
jgi:hypothetical protein